MVIKFLAKSLLYTVGGLFATAVLAIAAVFIGMRFEHQASTELPRPSGPFAVGRTTFHWTDSNRPDEFAPVPGTGRELLVWVWYPTRAASGTAAPYLPPAWREAVAHSGGALMNNYLTRDLSKVRVYSRENVDLAPDAPTFPVVILRAGLSAQVTGYTALAEDLASHGYVVVGPDAAYRTNVVVFPDGRVVTRPPQYNLELLPEAQRVPFATRLLGMWSADIGFVVDQLTRLNAFDLSGRFTGRLDLEHLGVFGHSLGGATAAHFCHEDSRCKAGINLDGQLFGPVIQDGLRQPFMFVLEGHDSLSAAGNSEIFAHIQSMYEHLPLDSRRMITLVGSNHFSFTDQILLKSHTLLGVMRRIGAIGALDGRRGLEVTAACVSSFFDVHLKGQPQILLDDRLLKYAELRVE
jgi:dienelactone hydrolase